MFAFWAVLIACGGGGGGTSSGTNFITYTSANHLVYPNLNGEYTFDDGGGYWLSFSGSQEFTFEFNYDNTGNARVLMFIQTPVGTTLQAGQTFSWANTGAGWYFGTATSLTDPNSSNNILSYTTTGTLTINSVTTNTNGSKTVSFSFTYGGTSGITGTGSGTCTLEQNTPV